MLNFKGWRDPCPAGPKRLQRAAASKWQAFLPATGRHSSRCGQAVCGGASEFSRAAAQSPRCACAWTRACCPPAYRLRDDAGRRRRVLLPMDRNTACGLAEGIAPGRAPCSAECISGISCARPLSLHLITESRPGCICALDALQEHLRRHSLPQQPALTKSRGRSGRTTENPSGPPPRPRSSLAIYSASRGHAVWETNHRPGLDAAVRLMTLPDQMGEAPSFISDDHATCCYR